jgi:hypothetical protein
MQRFTGSEGARCAFVPFAGLGLASESDVGGTGEVVRDPDADGAAPPPVRQ